MAKVASRSTKTTKKKKVKKRKKTVNAQPETLEKQELDEDQAETGETRNEPPPAKEAKGSKKAGSAKEASSEGDESTHAKYERIKKGNLYLTDLQKLTVAELHDIAKDEKMIEYTALKKQDLIFRILKERIRQSGLLYGEGVLEVLPDGYGFLRNTDYNYLSSPDDIYVSPSQIRRFGLRTGNSVSGQIRPPKDSEKYFALLRVEAINFENPDMLA
ncbi:MAG: transcription termination factor Rho, partial [Planctomycetes bacterium]|nr:transcription termination factor Rho [Planctomycetota bacterium]